MLHAGRRLLSLSLVQGAPVRLFVTLLTLMVFSGCGSGIKPLSGMVPVSGKVTYQGKPVDHGDVYFTPVEPAQNPTAWGKIRNGTFSMVTTASSAGAKQGRYLVSIESREELPATETAVAPDPKAKLTPAKSLIPEKYSTPKSSGLEIDVVPGMAQVNLELKD